MDRTAYTPSSLSAVRRFRSKIPDKLLIEQFLEPSVLSAESVGELVLRPNRPDTSMDGPDSVRVFSVLLLLGHLQASIRSIRP